MHKAIEAAVRVLEREAFARAANQLRGVAQDYAQMEKQKESIRMPTEQDVRDKLTYRHVSAVLRTQARIIECM